MSAFLVEKTTINNIVSWLRQELLHHSYLRPVAERFGVDVVSDGWEQRLAQAMYALNSEAVNQRYDEKNAVPEIVCDLSPTSSRIAGWKALGCWLYQCSEGTIPQTKLYQYF